jgi:hypothetical protein
MHHRMPDFDLRPRRATTSPMPMRSTFDVDDEGDSLDALVVSALETARPSDARHIALTAMPSSLCQPAGNVLWIRTAQRRSAFRAMVPREPVLVGTMLSAALALLMFVAAVVWRHEHPRVVHVEDATPAVQTADLQPASVDAVSSASRR